MGKTTCDSGMARPDKFLLICSQNFTEKAMDHCKMQDNIKQHIYNILWNLAKVKLIVTQ